MVLLHGFNQEIVTMLSNSGYDIFWIGDDLSANVAYLDIRDNATSCYDNTKIPQKLFEYVSSFSSLIYECYSRHYKYEMFSKSPQYYHNLMILHTEWAWEIITSNKIEK